MKFGGLGEYECIECKIDSYPYCSNDQINLVASTSKKYEQLTKRIPTPNLVATTTSRKNEIFTKEKRTKTRTKVPVVINDFESTSIPSSSSEESLPNATFLSLFPLISIIIIYLLIFLFVSFIIFILIYKKYF
jgi:cellulose synthase/poly-beta-1,6-N-acetylglucosamine synthase-like glycosyltransferase